MKPIVQEYLLLSDALERGRIPKRKKKQYQRRAMSLLRSMDRDAAEELHAIELKRAKLRDGEE